MSEKIDNLIIGGGPAGLTAANILRNLKKNYILFESSDVLGGLCKTFKSNDGFKFDNFKHIFKVSKDHLKELQKIGIRTNFETISTPRMLCGCENGKVYEYPVQENLWNLEPEERKLVLKSFSERARNIEIKTCKDWCLDKFGEYFSEKYIFPYIRKHLCSEPDEIGTKWLTMNNGKSRFSYPGEPDPKGKCGIENSYFEMFCYPMIGGFSSFFHQKHKEHLFTGNTLTKIDYKNKIAYFNNGKEFEYENLISSIPLDEMILKICDDVPEELKEKARSLKYVSGDTVSIKMNFPVSRTDFHWMYVFDSSIKCAKVSAVSNISKANVPNKRNGSIQLEYFRKPESKPITEDEVKADLKKLSEYNLFNNEDVQSIEIRSEKYCNLVLKDADYDISEFLCDWLSERNITQIGRFGTWRYMLSPEVIISSKISTLKALNDK